MRAFRLAVLPLIGALALAPSASSAQVTATVQFGRANYGSEVRVYPYAADLDGDWRTAWRNWQPVTLYSANGRFYTRNAPGSRAVQVYRWSNQYFVPPRDAGFAMLDRRLQNGRRPLDEDYNIIDRLAVLLGQRPPRNWGSEVVVNTYASERYGDWRGTYLRWQPVTLYFRGNHYFTRAVPGSRAVAVYSWNGQYFLPPQDQQWNNADRRYNYSRRPNNDDYTEAQRIPDVYGQRPGNPPSFPANDVTVSVYSPAVFGDWRSGYRQWETTTLYSVNGKFYQTQVPGSRAVMVYHARNQFFLPPQDRDWSNADRRYNYRIRPTDDDYSRARRPTP